MNIFAAIKKAINSDLNKPLNITLGEIQASVNNVRKASRHVAIVTDIPYNSDVTQQILTTADPAVLSVAGSGRILQMIPICDNSAKRSGTVLLSIDDEIILNSSVAYSYGASDTLGNMLIAQSNNDTVIRCAVFSSAYTSYYFNVYPAIRASAEIFMSSSLTLVSTVGIPFKNGFDLRLTQSVSSTGQKAGVVVVYELYE